MTLDEKIGRVLDSADRMFIATAVGGNPSAASVFFARDGEDLLFFTFNPTRKAEQIRLNRKVQVAVWPREHNGIRGLQIEGICEQITDPDLRQTAREKILAVTDAFKAYMDDPFLVKNNVVGYYRVRPVVTKYVDFHDQPQFRWREYAASKTPWPAEMWYSLRGQALAWLRALRAPFFTATLVPVSLGGALAARQLQLTGIENAWHWPTFFLVLLGAIAAHAGTNLANDYGDHTSRADERNKTPSPFSGGSRVIQAGILAPWQVLVAALICFAITIVIGLQLNMDLSGSAFAPSPLLWIGIIGCLFGLTYTLGPYRLGYHGLGEAAVAIGFGPVLVLGAHYVMTSRAGMPWEWLAPLLASLPVALLVMAIVWINQFQDAPADAASGKITWVVRLARCNGNYDFMSSLWIYAVLLAVAFALIVVLSLLGVHDPGLATPAAAIGLLPVPLAVWAVRRGFVWHRQWLDESADHARLPYDLLPVNAVTIGLHLVTGTLLVIAYLI